jgi:hypothetical protein
LARPRNNIDPELVRRLAGLGLTQRDIASFVGCSQSLISLRFSSSYDLGASQSEKSLRALMWRQARGGSAPITLRLDQRLFGPLQRKQAVDDAEVLEALDQANKAAAAAEKLA